MGENYSDAARRCGLGMPCSGTEGSISRRRVLRYGASLGFAPWVLSAENPMNSTLTAVPGIRVGHWTHATGSTGCTAVLVDGGAVAGVDVRGGGPGTRETDLLRPEASVEIVHAVVLSGGSAYGLATADGVMRFLEGEGVGYPVGSSVVPIVPAAILFDLGVGDPAIRPNAEAGFLAAEAASSEPVDIGNVGAGAGASVGKMFGRERAMRGGLGSAAVTLPNGLVVGALAAVNALGDVVDPARGTIVAGARDSDGADFVDSMDALRRGNWTNSAPPAGNTTLGLVAANVAWTKAQATRAAQMAQDGLAMAVRPAHMPFDGDTVFALGTGGPKADARLVGMIGALAADVLAQAILVGVRAAEDGFGLPSVQGIL